VARRPRHLALAAMVALGLLAGCGSDPEDSEPVGPVGDERAGSVAQLAECSDWTAGDRAEREATVEVIKAAINLEDGTGETPELSDEEAYRVIDTTCGEDFAANFRLYKVYARATSFASFAE
jgi:hypothetical protein